MTQLTTTNKRDVSAKRRPWKDTLEVVAPSFSDALPAHVTIDRFKRILASAIGSNRDLQRAVEENPSSVWNSALAAAKDGLIPDGREAALVVFNTNVKCDDGISRKLATAQYMPMIGGILKMMRQSGEVASIAAHIVYENDPFEYVLGDEEHINHTPDMMSDRGEPVGVYAVLHTKDGGIYREIMTKKEVMDVRNISRAKENGPWSGPFATEMWKKTVLRRLSKRAPLSTDVIDLFQRDDSMYELDEPLATLPPQAPRRAALDLSTGEVIDQRPDEDEEPASEVLEGDGLPGDDEPSPEPEAKGEPAEEQTSEPTAETGEPFATKEDAITALEAAKDEDGIDQILDAARSCSWFKATGAATSIEMKADSCRKALSTS